MVTKELKQVDQDVIISFCFQSFWKTKNNGLHNKYWLFIFLFQSKIKNDNIRFLKEWMNFPTRFCFFVSFSRFFFFLLLFFLMGNNRWLRKKERMLNPLFNFSFERKIKNGYDIIHKRMNEFPRSHFLLFFLDLLDFIFQRTIWFA